MTTGLAIRELWISFRLLIVMALFALAGVVAASVPLLGIRDLAPGSSVASWYAGGVAVAAAGAAALGSTAFAAERRRGGLAWLATRSVPRSLLLLGWLTALWGVALAGLLPSGLVAWLAISPDVAFGPRSLSPLQYGLALTAAAADVLAWISAGLLLAVLLPARLAGAATLLLTAALVSGALFSAALILPVGGFMALAETGSGHASWALLLRAGGVSLLTTALVVIAGMAALARRDL